MHRSAWIVGLGLIAMSHAHAQERLPLQLQWQAPAECPTAADVREQLERVARVRAGHNLTQLAARAEVQHRADAYLLNLDTEHDGQKGERHLEANDCNTLVRTLTLVLALAFGSGVEVSTEAAPASGTTTTIAGSEAKTADTKTAGAGAEPNDKQRAEPPPSPPRAVSTARRDEDRADDASNEHSYAGRGTPHFGFLIGGGAQFALLPTAAFAASAGLELAKGAWSMAARMTGWPGVSDGIAANVQTRFDGLAGALQGCGRLPLAPVTLALCGSARAAALRGRSSGAITHGSATAPWYALAGTAALTWPRENWLAVRLEASLAASLDRPRFVIDGLVQAHRVPLLVPDLSLSLLFTP